MYTDSGKRLDGEIRRYVRYAAAFLAATVLAGVWLRAGMLRPEALAGFTFGNLVHAHSHLAFFGWVTMALFALVLRGLQDEGAEWRRWHAHLMGAASMAAFVGFLWSGYAPFTIALSAVHVALWVVFTLRVWPAMARWVGVERAFFRAALAFLMIAGAGTVGTGVLSARASDPWTSRLAIEFFLTPFIGGWLVLGAFGAAYARLSRPRFAGAVLVLAVVGTLPAGLLHIAAAPPLPWLVWVGRAGTLLVAAATLAFARDVLRDRGASPLLRLAGGAGLAKGAVELTVGLGLTEALMGSQPLVIAYLHLVLLGMVTAILADALLAPVRAAAPAILHAGGLVLQLGALATLGWPPLFQASSAVGWDVERLLALALLGGVLSAVALIGVTARLLVSESTPAVTGRFPSAEGRRVHAAAAARTSRP